MIEKVIVVGAGVAGLSAAFEVERALPNAEVVVLERSSRVGGLIETERTSDGYLLEHGADSYLTTKPGATQAVRDLGLETQVVEPMTSVSSLATERGIHPLPPGLGMGSGAAWAIARSRLFSLPGKARAACEFFVPIRPRTEGDESIADFVKRRFGGEFAANLIDPVTQGIFGSRAEDLSTLACLPRLAAFEQEQRSIMLGVYLARRRSPPLTMARMVSFSSGMATVIAALERKLRQPVRTEHGVDGIEPIAGGRVSVHLADDRTLTADRVIVAIPAWAAVRLFESGHPSLAAGLSSIPHGRTDIVTLSVPRDAFPKQPVGTGFVVSRDCGLHMRACTFLSAKWPGRSPEGTVLVRTMFHESAPTDAELLTLAREELRELTGLEGEPSMTRVRRRERAMPRYAVGHLELVARIEDEVRTFEGVELAGNAYHGVGVPDCIRSGRKAASRVLLSMGKTSVQEAQASSV